jgi:hypothetical protein
MNQLISNLVLEIMQKHIMQLTFNTRREWLCLLGTGARSTRSALDKSQ